LKAEAIKTQAENNDNNNPETHTVGKKTGNFKHSTIIQ